METKNQNAAAQVSKSVTPDEIKVIQAQSAAQFALTAVGQQLKQFEVQQRMGQMYVQSTIVPDTYKGNIGNCIIAIDMAMRMNANPLMVMQNLYIVHGNPAFSSKFLIATINASGRYSPLRYEFRGKEGADTYACRCYAYEASDKEHKEPLCGDWVSIELAKKEGWFEKPGSKWKTMPNQMLRYRAAAFWQRVYCPEISMGLMTSEEVEDIDDQRGVDYKTEIDSCSNKETLSMPQQPQTAQVLEKPKPEPIKAEQPMKPSDDLPFFMQDEA